MMSSRMALACGSLLSVTALLPGLLFLPPPVGRHGLPRRLRSCVRLCWLVFVRLRSVQKFMLLRTFCIGLPVLAQQFASGPTV